MIKNEIKMEDSLANYIVDIISESNDVYNAAIGTVGSATQKIIESMDETKEGLTLALSPLVCRSIEAVHVSGKEVGDLVKGIVIGVLQAGAITDRPTDGSLASLAYLAIGYTAKLKGNVPAVVKGLLEGVMEGFNDISRNPDGLILEIGAAAIRAGYDVSFETGENVKRSMSEMILKLYTVGV